MILIQDVKSEKSFSNSDIKDIEKLAEMATEYLKAQTWCEQILKQFYCATWNDLFGIFYFEIAPSTINVDKNVWIVVGDVPPAYIDIESAQNECEVIESYIYIMRNWVDAVENNGNIANCFPINVPPTREFSEMLKIRLTLIEDEILPDCGSV